MKETDRRQFIKTIGIIGATASTAGCHGRAAQDNHSSTLTQIRNTTTTANSEITTTASTETTTAARETNINQTKQYNRERYKKIRRKARKVVHNIRKEAREGLNESTIFLGNINKFDFSILSKYYISASDVEKVTGKTNLKNLEQSDYEKLLEDIYQNRINERVKYDYMTESPASDTIEPGLLMNNELKIDVIKLGKPGPSPEKIKKGLSNRLKAVLPSEYKLSVDMKKLGMGTDSDEAFVKSQKNYSQNKPGTLQLYLTQKALGELAGYGLEGYAPIDGDTVIVYNKINKLFGHEEKNIVETAVHEVGHSAFDLPHSASPDDIMFYTDSSGETNNLAFGRRSKHLIQRYLGSKFEAKIPRNKESLRLSFKPSTIKSSFAKRDFLNHLETYMRVVEDFEDFENWNLEYNGQNRMGNDKATAIRQFGIDESLQIDISIGSFFEDISLRATS